MKEDKYWTDYWHNEKESGEVFVNNKGEKPKYLSTFWQQALASVENESAILDVACGAGSIFQALPEAHNYALYGADISVEALNKLSSAIEGVTTINCKSDQLPLTNDYIDVVVSQFGVEYSGELGFLDALRVLRPSGRFIFISHYKEGYIDAKNRQELDGVLLVKKMDFINKARTLTSAIFDGDKEAFDLAFKQFSEVEPILLDYSQKFPEGIHVHLYNGFRQLLTHREEYSIEDITGWLDGIAVEVDTSLVRLQSMCDAALSAEDIKNLSVTLSKKGAVNFNCEPFYGSDSLPIAWHISGIKK